MKIDKLNDFLSLYGSIRMGCRINLNKNASHPFIREFGEHLNAYNAMFKDRFEAACNEIEDNVMNLSLFDKPKIKHYLQNAEALINDRTADLKGITVKDISEKLLNKTKWSAYDTYLYNCDQCKDMMLNEVRRLRAKYLGKPTNPKEPKSPVIALFCLLVSVSGIEPQNDRSAEKYCKEICEKYGLRHRVRVHKALYGSDTKSNRDKVVKQILPNINKADRNKILQYLNHDSKIYS